MRKVPYHLQEKPSPASYLARYVPIAQAIVERIAAQDIDGAVALTLNGRRTMGARAALLAGLAVNACRDRCDVAGADDYLAKIAQRIDR